MFINVYLCLKMVNYDEKLAEICVNKNAGSLIL